MKINSTLRYCECSNSALTIEYRFKDSYPSHLSLYPSFLFLNFNALILSVLYDNE